MFLEYSFAARASSLGRFSATGLLESTATRNSMRVFAANSSRASGASAGLFAHNPYDLLLTRLEFHHIVLDSELIA